MCCMYGAVHHLLLLKLVHLDATCVSPQSVLTRSIVGTVSLFT